MCFAHDKDMNFRGLGADSCGMNPVAPDLFVEVLIPHVIVWEAGPLRR